MQGSVDQVCVCGHFAHRNSNGMHPWLSSRIRIVCCGKLTTCDLFVQTFFIGRLPSGLFVGGQARYQARYTIMLEGLPPSLRTNAALERYLERIFPGQASPMLIFFLKSLVLVTSRKAQKPCSLTLRGHPS